MSSASNKPALDSGLTRKLLLQNHPKQQRISSDALQMASELLRLFIVEAKQRASVEVRAKKWFTLLKEGREKSLTHTMCCFVFLQQAECEKEGNMDMDIDNDDDDSLKENNDDSALVTIRADHVSKIAAELLMDFS